MIASTAGGSMARTYIVTGSASGIGRATVEVLRNQGHTVFGADLRDAEIIADLSTAPGRDHLVERAAELSGGKVDGVIAVAGLLAPKPVTVAVNYFGAVATLTGLRPLLLKSPAPRAAVVASYASIADPDEGLLELLDAGDEAASLEYSLKLGDTIGSAGSGILYFTTKRAIALWMRRNAPTAEWAGSGIALNAIAPGVIDTPMIAHSLATAEARKAMSEELPTPFNGPAGPPSAPAALLAWLTSSENTFVAGQFIFVDGGAESLQRPERL